VISVDYFRQKNPSTAVKCFFCHETECDAGELLAFQLGTNQILVHEKCLRYSNVVDDGTWSENSENYFNVFKTFDNSDVCEKCGKNIATIKCSRCQTHVHFTCALESGWKFEDDSVFLCEKHRTNTFQESLSSKNKGFHHDLLNTTSSKSTRVILSNSMEKGNGSTTVASLNAQDSPSSKKIAAHHSLLNSEPLKGTKATLEKTVEGGKMSVNETNLQKSPLSESDTSHDVLNTSLKSFSTALSKRSDVNRTTNEAPKNFQPSSLSKLSTVSSKSTSARCEAKRSTSQESSKLSTAPTVSAKAAEAKGPRAKKVTPKTATLPKKNVQVFRFR